MDKKLFKNILLILTYCILLVFVIVKLDLFLSSVNRIIYALRPIIWGLAIAFVLNKPYSTLKDKLGVKIKKRVVAGGLSLCVVYLAFFAIIFSILVILIPQLTENVRVLYASINSNSAAWQGWIYNLTDIMGIDIQNFEFSSVSDMLSKFQTVFTGVVPQIFNFTAGVVTEVINIVLGFIFSIYILLSKEVLKNQAGRIVKRIFKANTSNKILSVSRLTCDTFTNFITGQTTECLILGVLCFIGMLIFGFPYPFLISVIVAVTALIPIVGAYIGLIPSLFILAMVKPMYAVWFLVFIIVLQQLEGNFIYPKVVGSSIGLPAMWVLIAITVGGSLFGVAGMLLAVPTTSVIYQLIKKNITDYEKEK
ncbi:MAG: AI-2E family transporter [Oscillospiraceae bacterium]|nr:AI-2E family transporter [Oscillospiraceae bacterium]